MRLGSKLYVKGLVFLIIVIALSGCYKFEGDQTVPAYVTINSINLSTYYPEEGANTSDIIDAWVYVDGDLLGVFEFPDSSALVFPVLAEGKHDLEIRGGIKLNGISSTRAPYPFYESIKYEDFEFIPGTTTSLGNLTTTYQSTANFVWIEDFEQADITFEKIDVCSLCDTNIARTTPSNNPIAFLSPNSKYSGVINLTEERNQYGGTSYNSFDVPDQGKYTLLEIDIKTDNYLTVGILVRDQYNYEEKDLVILNKTDEWKKVYINLGSNLSLFPLAYDYKVIFRAGLDEENTNAEILIDNIKVVYR